MSVKFRTPDLAEHYRQLVSFALGEINHLECESFNASEVRFGISKPLKYGSSEGKVNLQVPSLPTLDVELIVSDAHRSKSARLAAKALAPGLLFPFVPKEYWRVKASARFFTFEWALASAGGTVSFSLPTLELTMNLSDWLNLGSLLDVLCNAETAGIRIEVKFPSGSATFEHVGSVATQGREYMETLRAALNALRLVGAHVDLDPKWAITTKEILGNRDNLATLQTILSNKPAEVNLRLQDDLIGAYQGRIVWFSSPYLYLGDHVICALLSIVGVPEKLWSEESQLWEISLVEPVTTIHSFMVMTASAATGLSMNDRVRELIKIPEYKDLLCIVPNGKS